MIQAAVVNEHQLVSIGDRGHAAGQLLVQRDQAAGAAYIGATTLSSSRPAGEGLSERPATGADCPIPARTSRERAVGFECSPSRRPVGRPPSVATDGN
jgi:hypothetical protein